MQVGRLGLCDSQRTGDHHLQERKRRRPSDLQHHLGQGSPTPGRLTGPLPVCGLLGTGLEPVEGEQQIRNLSPSLLVAHIMA